MDDHGLKYIAYRSYFMISWTSVSASQKCAIPLTHPLYTGTRPMFGPYEAIAPNLSAVEVMNES